jgi:hypothetical protein
VPPYVIEQRIGEGAATRCDPRIVDSRRRYRVTFHANQQRCVGESLCGAIDHAMCYQDSHAPGDRNR